MDRSVRVEAGDVGHGHHARVLAASCRNVVVSRSRHGRVDIRLDRIVGSCAFAALRRDVRREQTEQPGDDRVMSNRPAAQRLKARFGQRERARRMPADFRLPSVCPCPGSQGALQSDRAKNSFQELRKSAAPSAALRGSPGWTRTNNPPVNSRMLYQLSYRGSSRRIVAAPRTNPIWV
jgi:hypothetical protein